MEQERESSPAMEGLGDINIRVERLRGAIFDDTRQRANLAEYSRAEIELEKAEELYALDLVSEVELEVARAEYGRWEALAIDTEETKEWRDEIDRLQAVAMPSSESGTSPAMNVLQEMLLKYFHLQLERAELRERLAQLEEQSSKVKKAIAGLEAGQGEAATSEINVEPLFRVVSLAVPPVYPEKSNRRVLALAVMAVVGFLGLLVILAAEFFDTTIKSGPDLSRRLDVPLLVSLPESLESAAGRLDSANEFRFQRLAARLRWMLDSDQRRILITSHGSREGRRAVVRGLADVLARQDLRVLILGGDWSDGPIHPVARWVGRISERLERKGWIRLRRLLARLASRYVSQRILEQVSSAANQESLGEIPVSSHWTRWAEGESDALDRMICSTLTRGVDQLGLESAGVPVDALGSERFSVLLQEVTALYDLVLLAPPSCESGAWSELLAVHADIAVMVVGARNYRLASIRRNVDTLGGYQRPVAGVVVTGLESPFLELG